MSLGHLKKKRFGDILVEGGLISDDQVKQALDYGKENDTKLGQSLLELGFVDELAIAKTLSDQLSLPLVDFEKVAIDPKVVALIPEIIARKHRLIALGKKNNQVLVSFADPLNIFAIDEISKILTDSLVLCVAPESKIMEAIEANYKSTESIQIAGVEHTEDGDESEAVGIECRAY